MNEETLFRNYRKKMDLATKVVIVLFELEGEIGEKDGSLGIEKIAVSWKLKQLQRTDPSNTIKTILLLLENSYN